MSVRGRRWRRRWLQPAGTLGVWEACLPLSTRARPMPSAASLMPSAASQPDAIAPGPACVYSSIRVRSCTYACPNKCADGGGLPHDHSTRSLERKAWASNQDSRPRSITLRVHVYAALPMQSTYRTLLSCSRVRMHVVCPLLPAAV